MAISEWRYNSFIGTSQATSPYHVYYSANLQLIHSSSLGHIFTFISSSIHALATFQISILNHFTLQYFIFHLPTKSGSQINQKFLDIGLNSHSALLILGDASLS